MTTFSLRPVSGSDDRRGSSKVTFGSGLGVNCASLAGCSGSARLTASMPSECQVLNAMCGVSVGLCAEEEGCGGVHAAHVDGSFSRSRYSACTVGACGFVMSTMRAQPHGQPWPA